MGIIAFIILGAIAGAIAKAIMPGSDPAGFIVTTLIGIAGALLGGFLAAAIFGAHPLDEFFDIPTWLTAIVGSIILLAIYREDRQPERRARVASLSLPLRLTTHLRFGNPRSLATGLGLCRGEVLSDSWEDEQALSCPCAFRHYSPSPIPAPSGN